jgi:hypothetical protein
VTSRRFLRARRFDVDAAFQQFKDTEEWRKTNAIKALFENIDVDSYDEARRMVSLPEHRAGQKRKKERKKNKKPKMGRRLLCYRARR